MATSINDFCATMHQRCHLLRSKILLAGFIAVLVCWPAHSQTTFASITGLVADPSGAAIPNAKITATNVETNYAYNATYNSAGNYTVSQLREGTYMVTVT